MANFVEKNSIDDFSDLIELITEDEQNEMFEECSNFIQSNTSNLEKEVLLKFYALYKQSTEGHCTTAKPYFFDIKSKAKWEAWKNLGEMSANEAKLYYIDLVRKIFPNFEAKSTETKKNCWVRVSTMVPKPEDGFDADKESQTINICDLIRNEDVSNILQYLEANAEEKNELDQNGLGLLHYAADIGNLDILQLLINQGLNIDLTDSEGQTALHYAASCGHYKCVQFLLENGARTDIIDSDKCAPVDVASEEQIKELFIGIS